jgi:hypothetical protein
MSQEDSSSSSHVEVHQPIGPGEQDKAYDPEDHDDQEEDEEDAPTQKASHEEDGAERADKEEAPVCEDSEDKEDTPASRDKEDAPASNNKDKAPANGDQEDAPACGDKEQAPASGDREDAPAGSDHEKDGDQAVQDAVQPVKSEALKQSLIAFVKDAVQHVKSEALKESLITFGQKITSSATRAAFIADIKARKMGQEDPSDQAVQDAVQGVKSEVVKEALIEYGKTIRSDILKSQSIADIKKKMVDRLEAEDENLHSNHGSKRLKRASPDADRPNAALFQADQEVEKDHCLPLAPEEGEQKSSEHEDMSDKPVLKRKWVAEEVDDTPKKPAKRRSQDESVLLPDAAAMSSA